jgi:fatty-acyl-CoA synthase
LVQAEDEEGILSVLTMAGISVPLVAMRIVDEELNALRHDGKSRGELVLRAPWLTQGYLGEPKASDELWRGGWLHTQDIATIDPHGQLQIRDRLKDVIKTGGEWIDSVLLEELVGRADGIEEASVVAVADQRWGERPVAFVVARPGIVLTLEMLNAPVVDAIASGAITRYAKLDRFEVVDRLPRTSVGKVDKRALRARINCAA